MLQQASQSVSLHASPPIKDNHASSKATHNLGWGCCGSIAQNLEMGSLAKHWLPWRKDAWLSVTRKVRMFLMTGRLNQPPS